MKGVEAVPRGMKRSVTWSSPTRKEKEHGMPNIVSDMNALIKSGDADFDKEKSTKLIIVVLHQYVIERMLMNRL